MKNVKRKRIAELHEVDEWAKKSLSSQQSLFGRLSDNHESLHCILKDGEMVIMKEILVEQCEVFRTMLNSSMLEELEGKKNTLLLPTCTMEIFRRFRKLLYCDGFPAEDILTQESMLVWSEVLAYCDVHLWTRGKNFILHAISVAFKSRKVKIEDMVVIAFEHRKERPSFWMLVKDEVTQEILLLTQTLQLSRIDSEIMGCFDTIREGGTIRRGNDNSSYCCRHSLSLYQERMLQLQRKLLDLERKEPLVNVNTWNGLRRPRNNPHLQQNRFACWKFSVQHNGIIPPETLNTDSWTAFCCEHRQPNQRDSAIASEILEFNRKRRNEIEVADERIVFLKSFQDPIKVELLDEILDHSVRDLEQSSESSSESSGSD